MSKLEWDQLQQLSYNVMPQWWYNTEQRDANYEAYVKGYEEWQEKFREKWGSESIYME
tara:strand:+ start:563 stop:736 length:174 start_codon:yes stop_codon:yes gene_type:complete